MKTRKERIVLADHRSGLVKLERRLLLRSSLSLGALSMLAGCNLQDDDAVDKVLWSLSRWNDRVQAALFPQTLLALDFGDQPLPTKYGFPLKLRVPTKLGFKNPKHIAALFVTNKDPGGYWEDQGYNGFSGL